MASSSSGHAGTTGAELPFPPLSCWTDFDIADSSSIPVPFSSFNAHQGERLQLFEPRMASQLFILNINPYTADQELT